VPTPLPGTVGAILNPGAYLGNDIRAELEEVTTTPARSPLSRINLGLIELRSATLRIMLRAARL
jgi:hypothetical protein